MSISVVCQKCGKALKVKDEWRGKRATCPGCNEKFIVGGGGVAVTKPGVTTFDPAAAAAAKAKREGEVGKVSISWGYIFGAGVVLLLCVGIGMFLAGPKRVSEQWDALGDKPKDSVTDVVTRGLECYFQQMGMYNPRKSHHGPAAQEVMFYRPTLVMSMPAGVEFRGMTNVGPFKGLYHPATDEIEAVVAIGAGMGIPGSGGQKTTGMTITITGHEKDGKLTTYVNGKQVELVMPPITDDGR